MKKMFLLFSHKLTEDQEIDAKNTFDIEQFIYLPPNLQHIFSNVPVELKSLSEYLIPIKIFLKENSEYEDLVLIQGDFGVVYQMVNFVKSLGLKAVYSTTLRLSEEVFDAEGLFKMSIFKHRRFREYE